MMRKLFAAELLVVMVILLVKSGEGLKCFVCRDDQDKGCGGSNKSLVKDCPAKGQGQVYCRKIHQKLKFKNQDGFTSIRECAYESGGKKCYKFKWLELADQITCECNTESCNGGGGLLPDIFILALILPLRVLGYLRERSNETL